MTLVALVDDHQLFSASLAMALAARGLDVDVPPLDSLPQLGAHLMATRPGVLLVDRDLGSVGSGEDLIGPASANGTSVVVVSALLDDVTIGRCLARGAVACVSKISPLDSLLTTVLAVAGGRYELPATERDRLIDSWRRWESGRSAVLRRFGLLTGREAAVLAQLVAGRSVRAIAEEGFVSEATVRTQVRAILTKLGATSQLEAVAMAARARWTPPAVLRRRCTR